MKQELKFLLLQARELDDPVRPEEKESFARHLDCNPEQVVAHDLLSGPPSRQRWQEFDALLCGGSGEYYVSKGHLPHLEPTLAFFREVADAGRPMFASCFGFHLSVMALGGKLIHDPNGVEVGTFELTRLAPALNDPLFGSLPTVFLAQLGRKDRATLLPPGCENFAASAACPLQAFRVPDKPFWASQFHPELDGATNRARFERYIEGYSELMSREEIDRTLASYRASPESSALLSRFVDFVVAERHRTT